MLWALVFWKENIKTQMDLRFVPFVSPCFVERFGAPHQNIGFHYKSNPKPLAQN
jgi:hypothetical protein